MKTSIKIVLIGAGSKEFSRNLINDLVLNRELSKNFKIQVVLLDIDKSAANKALHYADWCLDKIKVPISFSVSANRPTALTNADFILLFVANNRMDLWEQDFRVPVAFGVKHILGENGGPGALFHALRNIKLIQPILQDIEDICPDALLMNFTNPEARILTAILTLTKVKAIGLCHGFNSFHEFAYKALGYEPGTLDIRTAGMNHFYTYYKIEDKTTGENLIPLFKVKVEKQLPNLPPLVRFLWENFGILGYMDDYHVGEYIGYANEFIDMKWLFGIESRKVLPGRTAVNSTTAFAAWREKKSVETYLEEGNTEDSWDYFSHPAKWKKESIKASGELAVPIIADILLDRKILRPSVNIMNTEGYIENLSPDGCIEVPAVVDSKGIHPDFIGSLPEAFAAQVRLQHSIQKLIIKAYKDRSKKLLLQALLIDPVSISPHKVSEFLDYMLSLQKDYLPEFY